ncbi:DUF2691 family protein [Planococcus sp. CPCC 101016]|uniref:DUF2691 family protein n=1 Tax=Planococcus sp. CPCC 101016 TaxID=2599617 RepID=UPI0011B5CDEA|nr:DUF2691 family protein [Planococcus sp. CPCC 101016]TWT06350.1 DUF2691 family protein [Planococcus sp. CPCC 101016]
MKRGISFELPNEYGFFLAEILKPIDMTALSWRLGSGESYKVVNNELSENLFLEDEKLIEGKLLKKLLENNPYYVIVADLQAHPKGKVTEINTYEEFVKSECELVLLVVDCYYATVYCKNSEKLELLYTHAHNCGFENIEYITDENDGRTRLSV